MKADKYVIINNRAYDPITGLPAPEETAHTETVAVQPATTETARPVTARGLAVPAVHMSVQKSSTLRRKYVKQPVSTPTEVAAQPAPLVRNHSPMSTHRLTTKQVEAINKFHATIDTPAEAQPTRSAQAHPVVQRAHAQPLDSTTPRRQRTDTSRKLATQSQRHAQPQQPQQTELKSASILKNEAIATAMSKEVETHKKSHRTKRHHASRWPKFMTAATASLAIVLLAGYFTYLSMPNLSIKMAAVQSGVNAKYPGYHPDGYALNGPITFSDGEVRMRFAYVDGNHGFTITQQRSSWSSSAVKQMIDDKSDSVTTTTVNGLTIYTHDGKTTWVNSGILYTIEGDAALSNSQLQRIATSL